MAASPAETRVYLFHLPAELYRKICFTSQERVREESSHNVLDAEQNHALHR